MPTLSTPSLRPRVIGIAGPARAGKDTAADMLIEMGVSDYRYSFADPIRAMIKAGFGVDLTDPYWQDKKELPAAELGGQSPRSVMQTLGTEWGRERVLPDLWLQPAMRRLQQESHRAMVVADVRFENEATWVRTNGVLLHISNNRAPRVRAHASEAGIVRRAGDFELANNASKADLWHRLAQLFICQTRAEAAPA